ncbi:hypothetical protein BDN70DRAFT_476385 [Pholiota conissans]|uniref:Uncharacterized protein n=1 Tax=Pholiota conissans TaxID=109636 RepID=A0A9P5YPR6_9AGAR|nr:hypothetical protein BDN70DRAFT_476385 [Pholiota conissans]
MGFGSRQVRLHTTTSFHYISSRGLCMGRVMTDLRGASVVILVPDTTKCFLALCPTYILTASAGTKISVSVDGSVNVSGPGTICLQVNDSTREPESFMRQIFRDNNLDGWNVVASDAQRQFVVFSSAPSTVYPAHVIGIPLWSTYHLKPVLKLASSSLAHGIEQPGLEEFAVIRRDESQLHIFNLGPAASRMIYLEFDTAGNDFVITPIYRLHIKKSHILRGCWGAAALIQHRSIPAPFLPCNPNTLPTPPPSPPLPQIVSIVAGPSMDNLTLSSVEEIRHESHERPEGPDQTELQAEPHISLGKDPTSSVPREVNVWVFRYIVASFNALIRILFGHILWSHRTKRSSSQVKEQSQNKVNTTSLTNDVVENAAVSKNGFQQQQQQTKEQISSNETPAADTTTVTKINTESTEQSSDYPDLLAPTHDVELGHFCPSTSLDKGTDNFYAELLLSAQDHLGRVGYKLGSVDIVLIPLPSEDATSENLIDHAAASTDTSPSLKTELEGAVSSIDERGPLTCTFTQLQTFFANPGHSERLNPITFISYLVRYQLALGANGNNKSISISSPLEGGV